jgi:hypothetical protein
VSADVCVEHQQENTVENPCRLCTIKVIRDWSVSKDGTAEAAEAALAEIQRICEEALGITPEDGDGS